MCIQDRASPKLREALHDAARAAKSAAAAMGPAMLTSAQPAQQPSPQLAPPSTIGVAAPAPPLPAMVRTPFMDSPPPASLVRVAQRQPPSTLQQPSSEGGTPVPAGILQPDEAVGAERQTSLIGAWLPPAQSAGTPHQGFPRADKMAAHDDTSASDLVPHQPAEAVSELSGRNGEILAEVCVQQAELRPFRPPSLPEAVTPRLSPVAGWSAMAGLSFCSRPVPSGPADVVSKGDGGAAAVVEAVGPTGQGAGAQHREPTLVESARYASEE